MGGMQQLTPLLPVSGPEPHLCSSSSLPFLVQLWAAPQEPHWAIVTPTDAVLVLRSVPFNTHHAPLLLFSCLFISEKAQHRRPKVWLGVLLHRL